MQNRMISTELVEEDIKIENHLRPQMLSDYKMQHKLANAATIQVFVSILCSVFIVFSFVLSYYC